MTKPLRRMAIGDIETGDRDRADPGNLEALGESIATVGLRHPIVVTPSGQLISGYRRLAACAALRDDDMPIIVPVLVPADISEGALLLRAEREDPECATPMTGTEIICLVRRLASLERPPGHDLMHRTVSDALGMSHTHYYHIKQIAEAARTDADPDKRSHALDSLALIDRILAGERIDRTDNAGRRVALTITAVHRAWITRPAEGVVRARGRRVASRQQRTALASGVASLSGLTAGLATVGVLDPAVTPEEAAQWALSVLRARRILRDLHTTLKERAHATR